MTRTLDDLLTDLSDVVPIINAERHRIRAADFVRKVFRRIELKFICDTYTDAFELNEGQVQLQDHMIDILDAGLSKDRMDGVIVRGAMNNLHPRAFRINSENIEFLNMRTGVIWIHFYGLQRDADKHPLIPELAYDACYNYALAQMLRMDATHPLHSEWQVTNEIATQEINRARADFNRRGITAQEREMRKSATTLHNFLNRNWLP